MSENPSFVPSDEKQDALITKFKRTQRIRFFRALNYISIYFFILVVYGGLLIFDYFLFQIMWWVISPDATKYPLISSALDFAKMGLGLLFILGALIHGFISTYSQIQLDLKLLEEEKE